MKQASQKAIVNYSDIHIPQFVDIILSGDDDGVFLDYYEPSNSTPSEPITPPVVERYVVTENEHEFDVAVSGYGENTPLNYNDPD
jgi:hypothetical protein